MDHKILFFFQPFKNIKPFLAHSLYKNRWWAKFGPSLKGSQSQALAHGFFLAPVTSSFFSGFLHTQRWFLPPGPRCTDARGYHRILRLKSGMNQGGNTSQNMRAWWFPAKNTSSTVTLTHLLPTIQPSAAQGRALDLGLPWPGLRVPHLQSRESLSNGLDLLCRLKRHYTKYLGHGPRRERTPTKVHVPIRMIFILIAIPGSVTFVSTPHVQVQVSIQGCDHGNENAPGTRERIHSSNSSRGQRQDRPLGFRQRKS